MHLRLHTGALLYPSRAAALPLGKTRFLASGTVGTCGAWAECLCGEQGNILFCWRFHDPWFYPLGIASVILLEFVTLGNCLDSAEETSYYVPYSYG
jgi:hypothetical protein